jgi:tetratricopeptide (TPR) repeat protein
MFLFKLGLQKKSISTRISMTAVTQRLLFILCAMALLFSCTPKPGNPSQYLVVAEEVAPLIKKGSKLQNAHADSLPLVYNRLNTLAQQSGDKTALIYSELFKAHYFWMSSKHDSSMAVAIKCLADIEQYKIERVYPQIYSLISNLHKENTNYKMAFEAQQNALKWAITNNDTAMIISSLSQKAMLIHTIRRVIVDTAPDTSINVQMQALKIAEKSPKYEAERIPLYDNVGQYYLDNKDYDKAIYYAGKGAALAEKLNRLRSLTYGYAWIGQAYFFKGEQEKGLGYIKKAIEIAKEIKEPYREMELYEHLEKCYYAKGDYRTSLGLMLRAQRMREQLKVKENEVKMGELQIKYETVKKDNKIAQMGQRQAVRERQLIVVVASCMLVIVFSIILFLQYRLIRKRNRLTIMSSLRKDKALEQIAFIQSHELRKPLASILGLITVLKFTEHEVDREALDKLEEAGEELDMAIRSIIVHVEEEAKG